MTPCVTDGCNRPVKVQVRGLCNTHYKRLQRSGPLPPVDRFWSRVLKQEGCWEWLGHRNRDGYGMYGGRPAHRLSYERVMQMQVPGHLHIDHLCRNHGCVNPDHLRPRAPHENLSDNSWGGRTECMYGHPWDEANTRVRLREGRPVRTCRACEARRQREMKARRAP